MPSFDFATFEPPPSKDDLEKAMLSRPITSDFISPTLPRLDVIPEKHHTAYPSEPPSFDSEIQLSGLNTTDFSQTPEQLVSYPFEPAFPEINDLVDVWYIINPDIPLYPWQTEELLRISGYINGKLSGPRVHFTADQALRYALVTVNGSGKDMVLIATIALGLPLLYKHVYVVITSSSYEQLKYQTARHIDNGARRLNENFGAPIYTSVEFYHRCEGRGGEIKLFVTDEAGRAEGWHPMHPKGRLVIIANEAKSINSTIFAAFDRCSGYSHWLEVSSPGKKRGLFYNNHLSAIKYPNLPQRGRYFTRKIHQGECPHKSREDAMQMLRKHGEMSYEYQTSVLCNFFEQEETVAIPITLIEDCRSVVPHHDPNDIGIGLDLAAGGDETTLYVREGAQLVFKHCFRENDTERTADIIDDKLSRLGLKSRNYEFNIDDGGIGKPIGDKLTRRGWSLVRRNNQSPSFSKSEYLNLGAEMYFHTRRLFEHRFLAYPDDVLLIDQLSQRSYDETESQGKRTLESKKFVRARGGKSPDRADGFVLCYFSYRPDFNKLPTDTKMEQKRLMTHEQFIAACNEDPSFLEKLIAQQSKNRVVGDFTFQTGRI
jgi:hypothetical protein